MGKSSLAIDPLRKISKQESFSVSDGKPKSEVTADLRADAITHYVLRLASREQYPQAIEQLKKILDLRPEYPQFRVRSERYVNYAIDLVNGIKAKRSLAGMKQLASSKQQELFDKALSHFDDLRKTLKKIERIEHEVKLEDIKSTIWVVKAAGACTFAILILFFAIEVSHGVLEGANVLADDAISQIVNKIFDTLHI